MILDSVQNICLAITPVHGCIELDEGNLIDNSYDCVACDNTTHFLQGAVCELRTHVPNCETYHGSQNVCSLCKIGFYLSSDKLQCLNDPTGIPKCDTHDPTGMLCIKCNSSSYPSADGSICSDLTAEETKTNCIKYDTSKTCVECDSGFWWDSAGSTCVTITAKNCLEYADFNACKSCIPMYYLDENANAFPRNCVAVAISNCKKNSGDKCILCDNNYKLSEDGESCFSASETIPYCIAYKHDNSCMRCETPFILDEENNKCFIESSMNLHLDPNCSSYSLKANCNTCKQGYYFDETGKCVECSSSNCHFCERGGTKCSFCLPGHFMNIAGECTLNQFLSVDETEFIVIDNHTMIFTVMSWMIGLLYIFVK